jgi:hypothetical protein
MVSQPVFSQLALMALVWRFVMLRDAWPSDRARTSTSRGAHRDTPPALHRAAPVCGSDVQALWRFVRAGGHASPATVSAALRPPASNPPTPPDR